MSDVEHTLKVPKDRVPVRVLLSNQTVKQIELFVPVARIHQGGHRGVLSVLERGSTFLPSQDAGSGEWILLNREAVVWAVFDLAQLDITGEFELFDRVARVQVEFMGGHTLKGKFFYTPPTARARVVDHLNGNGRFFVLHQERCVYMINKSFVVGVIEHSDRAARGEQSLGED